MNNEVYPSLGNGLKTFSERILGKNLTHKIAFALTVVSVAVSLNFSKYDVAYAAEPITITVQQGDSLSGILINNGIAMTQANIAKFATSNGIADPNIIEVGQQLVLDVDDYITSNTTDNNPTSSEPSIPVPNIDTISEPNITSIVIDLSDQTMCAYLAQGDPVCSYVITGKLDSTPVGNFFVFQRTDNIYMSGSALGDTWSKLYARYFFWITDSGIGIHNAYWRTLSEFNGAFPTYYSGSHGCINSPDWIMDFFARYLKIGTPVKIQP